MTNPDTSTGVPKHYIETSYKGCIYRYYGYAHLPSARCVGEGDWRAVADGKEYRTNGAIVPSEVLKATVVEIDRQHAEHVKEMAQEELDSLRGGLA